MKKKSWKTTTFALLAAVGGSIVTGIQTGVIDATHLPVWLKGIAGMLTVVGGAGVGVFARDNNVTSEDAGATTKVEDKAAVIVEAAKTIEPTV